MKNLYYFLIGLLLSFVLILPFAHAETTAATVTREGYCGSSCATIKNAIINAYTPQTVGNIAEISGVYWSSQYSVWVVNYKWTLSGGGTTNWHGPSGDVNEVYSCPSTGGWSLSGQSCTRADCTALETRDSVTGACVASCPSGEHWDNAAQSCHYDSCEKGKTLDSGWYGDTNNDGLPTATACYKGCKGVYSGAKDATYAYWGGYTSQKGFLGSYKADGTTGTCSTASKTLPTTEADTQKNQTALGCLQSNQSFAVDGSGAVVCVPLGTSGVVPVTSTDTPAIVNNADGTKTETVDTTEVSADGTVTTTQTTKSYDAQGNLTGTSVTGSSSSMDSFCKNNPNSKLCGEGGTTSGGDVCLSPPVCSGDPINCAIQFQTWKTRCEVEKQNTNISEAKAWADEQLSTGDPASPFADSQKTYLNVGVFNTTDMLGNASCPAPKSFTVLGRTYQIPFDVFCNIAAIIGHILVIGASILSLRLVMGAL